MNVRRVIQEIHRRSLWQVLAIYLGGSWVALQAVEYIAKHVLLPSWIPSLAFVLVLVGLPIVLATAFVQEAPEGSPDARRGGGSGGREPAAGPPAPTAPAARSPSALRRWLTWRNALAGAVGAFALWGIVAAAWVVVSHREERDTPAIDRIAVLPLENLTGDSAQAYFAEAMTEELITELAQVNELLVISRSAVMRYRENPAAVRQVARELGVDAVIEGSVVRAGNEVRITAQLIDGRTEAHLWARDYVRDFRDLLALQKDVAREIAAAVQVRLTPHERTRLAESRSVDPGAQEAYLRGVYLQRLYEQNQRSDTTIAQSITYLERAVAIEPDWADAWAELAHAYHWGASSTGRSGATLYRKSKAAAREAIRLDPSSALGHAALAFVLNHYDLDWAGAGREYRRVLELAPNDHLWAYGLFQLTAGRYGDAALSLRRAQERDPRSWLLTTQLGVALACDGRLDDARAAMTEAVRHDPEAPEPHRLLGEVHLRRGEDERALTELRRAVELSSHANQAVGALAYAYAATDRAADARKLLPGLEARGAWIPAVYAVLGQTDRAVAQLRTAYRERRWRILQLRCFDPAGFENVADLGRLSQHRGFRALMEEIDFPQP